MKALKQYEKILAAKCTASINDNILRNCNLSVQY